MSPGPAPPVEGRLRRSLRSGAFTVTAEVGPPRSADPADLRRKARHLCEWVDAANVTDNQSSFVRVASWAGSLLLAAEDVEPVMQFTCRDRNRIALQSDLISAAVVGIPNVLLLTGDFPSAGDHPQAKAVFDLDSVQLIATARTLRDEHRLLSGRAVEPAPNWLIGAVENPTAPPARLRARRLAKKVAAGAEFVQTQFVFDVARFRRWVAELGDLGVLERCAVLAGVGPIRSLAALDHMQRHVAGVSVPEQLERRLRGVPSDRVAAEGVRACAETIEELRTVDGVAGVHVMAFAYEHGVPEILESAGVLPRREREVGHGVAPATAEVVRHAR